MSLLSKFDSGRRASQDGESEKDERQGLERRLVLRLLGHWRDLCGDRTMPTFEALDLASIPDMWPHCFILDRIEGGSVPVFRAVGEAFAAQAGVALVDTPITAAPGNTLAGHAVSYASEVVRTGIPISRGGTFTNADGNTVLYRSIILPMSDDDVTISGLLGAANCREVVPV